jgi:hypothetical protein
MNSFVACCLACLVVGTAINGCADSSVDEPSPVAKDALSGDQQALHVQESVRGRVVWLAEVLERRYGIQSDPDVAEVAVALETDDGRVLPLVKDDRGRGFWKDERLRGIRVELYVRRYKGSPLAQVIRVYTIKGDKRYEFDYWCEICAIPMYELKECECCQGPIQFRERLVTQTSAAEGAVSAEGPSSKAVPVGVAP